VGVDSARLAAARGGIEKVLYRSKVISGKAICDARLYCIENYSAGLLLMTVLDNKTASESSQAIWHILRTIDQRALALLKSGAPWEDGALDFELHVGWFSQAELRLITKWLSAWRVRIIKVNGRKADS
jgi:hypothetical protein